MESVKRYGHIGYLAGATNARVRLYPEMDVYVLAADFDRVSAENLALQQRLSVPDQREDDLKGLLRRAAAFTHDLMNPISLRRDIDAALNPTAEAESHE